MTARPTPELIERLRRAELLTPQQWSELDAATESFDTPNAFAESLVRRGWLTEYQATHFLNDQLDKLNLGGFRLLEPIANGGQGEVFRALQVKLDRVVALKRLRLDGDAGDAEALRRLRREALAVARLAHPNMVHIYDADEVNGAHFIVMEFVRGKDLARFVRDRGPLPVPMACDYIRQVALGLQHAHQHGLVHRDIKPSNLLVTLPDGACEAGTNYGLVKILDLGLARVLSDTVDSVLTRQKCVLGTPDYMSPEQARDSADVDSRTDLYSLGCTFYFLLAGHAPFPEGTAIEKMMNHQFGKPKWIGDTRRGIPAGVLTIMGKLMRREPADRYATAGEVAEALGAFLGQAPTRGTTWAGADDPDWKHKPGTVVCEPEPVRSSVSQNGVTPALTPAMSINALRAELSAPALKLESTEVSGIDMPSQTSFPSVSLLLRGGGKAKPKPKSKLLSAPADAAPRPAPLAPAPPSGETPRGDANPPSTPPIPRRSGLAALPPAESNAPPLPLPRRSGPAALPPADPPQPRRSGPTALPAAEPTAPPPYQVVKAPTVANVSLVNNSAFPVPAFRASILQGHTSQVVAMAFAHRGRFLATAGLDHAVRVWRIDAEDTRQETAFCSPQLEEIRAMAYLPGGGLLVSASGLGGRLWHWQWDSSDDGNFRAVDNSGCAEALAVSANGKQIAAASGRGILTWEFVRDRFRPRGILSAPSDVTALAFSVDGRRLYAGLADGRVQGWTDSWRGYRGETPFIAHRDSVTCLAASPNDRYIATAGTDNKLRFWTSRTPAELLADAVTAAHGPLRLLQFSQKGDYAATASSGGQVALWRATDGQMENDWRLNQPVITCLALADHLEIGAAARTDGSVCLYRLSQPAADTTVAGEIKADTKRTPLNA